MVEDGENPGEEVSERDIISPWYIRKRLGMSQREFANTLGVPVATLRNWEQNRVAMEPATIALMRILAREPEAALRALCEVADRHLHLLLASDTAFHEAQLRAKPRPSFIEPLVRLLHDGVADGSLRQPLDYADRANALFNTVCWSYVHLRGRHRWSAERASTLVLDLVLNGVA